MAVSSRGGLPGKAFQCEYMLDSDFDCGKTSRCKVCFTRNLVLESFHSRQSRMKVEGVMQSRHLGTLELRMSTIYLAEQDCVLVIIENISEIKSIERERIEKNKLQSAIETAGAVCHEMNQPLQVITGYLELLLASDGVSDKHREYMNICYEQVERLIGIVGQLRSLNMYRTSAYPGCQKILDIESSSQS